jgi:hypothetical protein
MSTRAAGSGGGSHTQVISSQKTKPAAVREKAAPPKPAAFTGQARRLNEKTTSAPAKQASSSNTRSGTSSASDTGDNFDSEHSRTKSKHIVRKAINIATRVGVGLGRMIFGNGPHRCKNCARSKASSISISISQGKHSTGGGHGPGGTDSGPCKYTCGEREILGNVRFFRDALRKTIDG